MPIRLSLPKPRKEWRLLVPESKVPKFVHAGFHLAPSKRLGKCVVTKRKSEWEKFEEETLILFRDGLKLRDVNGGPTFRIAGFQIDIVGGLEGTLLVVECKSKRELGKRSLRSDLRMFWVKRRAVTNSLRRRFAGRYKQTKFIMALKGITPSQRDLEYAKGKRITVWPESYFESIRSLYFTIGERAKYYVLKELGGRPPLVPGGSGRNFKFPAMAAMAGEDRVFSLFVPASILLDIAYVLRIESGQKKAYQRFLDKNRLFKIARFVEDGKSFKNSIVLALDGSSRFVGKHVRLPGVSNFGSQFGILKIPRQFASAWVIDGQHRLYAFARVEKEALRKNLLPVIALQSRSRTEEAETFVDINKNQKPVDPNLLWALFGSLYPHETRGVVSDLVRLLATEPRSLLRNKIYVPGESKHSRKKYRIFHSNLCETIGDHLVAGRSKGYALVPSDPLDDPERAKILKHATKLINSYLAILSAVAENIGAKEWIQGFFFTNNGLNVMIRVLVQILKYTEGRFSKQEIRTLFWKALSDYLLAKKNEIDQLRRQTSSEGTRDFAAFGFVRALAHAVNGFATAYLHSHQENREDQEPYHLLRQVEEALRELISGELQKLSPRWWKERIPSDVRDEAQERKELDEAPWPWMEGKKLPEHYYMNFSEYSKVICKRDNWREAFALVFRDEEWVRVIFKELEHIRNDVAHNRDLTERQMTILRIYSADVLRVISGARSKIELQVPHEVGQLVAAQV